jgi:hypothetical protein
MAYGSDHLEFNAEIIDIGICCHRFVLFLKANIALIKRIKK